MPVQYSKPASLEMKLWQKPTYQLHFSTADGAWALQGSYDMLACNLTHPTLNLSEEAQTSAKLKLSLSLNISMLCWGLGVCDGLLELVGARTPGTLQCCVPARNLLEIRHCMCNIHSKLGESKVKPFPKTSCSEGCRNVT